MKKLLVLIFVLAGLFSEAQNPSQVTPTQYSTGWFRQGWAQADSGTIFAPRIPNFTPRFPGTTILYQQNGVDSNLNYWNGARWIKLLTTVAPVAVTWGSIGGTLSAQTDLQNALNLKLNISDTSAQWVNNTRRLPGSLNVEVFKNGSWVSAYTDSISAGGTGTVTSVALSMPSAFTVSGSPITNTGTFSISGAGSGLQYIKGNGTLGTTDSGMIPNFYLKVRGLLSGTSPITYNSVTGAIGIPNANASGVKGAATFSNSDFGDNGAGLISLKTLVANGSCTNCSVTFGADGRATAYSTGTGPSGSGVDTIFRTPGVDSTYFTIGGTQYSVLDSTGGGGADELDWVNVVTGFGADSTGVIDATTAIQNAFNSLNGGRPKVVYFPSGTYLTTGNIHVPSCRILGVSGTNAMGFDAPQGNRTYKFDGTKILCTSATNNLFVFDSSGTIIEYCSLINTSVTTPSAGAGIKSMKPSTKILHCAVSGFYDNVWFDESPEYLVDDVFFSQYVRYGIYHRTFIEPDAGDQVITTSWFYPRNNVTMAGIHVESGGGLKLSNLKFNTNSTDTLPTNCVEVVLDNQTTSDLLVTNCSFENYTGKGISVKTINGGAFFHVVVNGNQFAPNSSNADAVFIDGSGGTIRDVAITGNAFGNADTAVYLNTVSSPSLIGNVFDVVNADIVKVNTSEFVELNYTKPSVNPDQINIRRSNAAPIYNTLANISSSAFASAGYRLRNSSSETAEFGLGSNALNGSSVFIKTSATGSSIKFSPENSEALFMNKDTVRISAPLGIILRETGESSTLQAIQGSVQLSANAHFNGSSWQRFNTSLPSWNVDVDPNADAFSIRHTAAGSGAITWTDRLKVAASGVVTINGAYSFPSADGTSGYVMTTNGSGTASWQAAGAATTIYNGNGTLASDRNVSSGGFTLRFAGTNNSDTLISVINSGTLSTGLYGFGTALGVNAVSNGTGLAAFGSTRGAIITGDTDEGLLVKSNAVRGARIQTVPSSSNTVIEVLQLERGVSGGPGADGIGEYVSFLNKTSDLSSNESNTIISKFTNATTATRTSQLSITGVNSGSTVTLMTLDGNGNATFGTTNSIVGTATNNNAVAGNIGEEVNSTVSTYANYTTTATYQNITSITLTAGDWDLSAFFTYSSNSATITAAANAIFAISTTTASASGATEGLNINYVPQAALLGTSKFSDAIPSYRVSLSGTTTYYLNTQATFTLGNPQYVGSLRARRCR